MYQRDSYIITYGADIIFAGLGDICNTCDFNDVLTWLRDNNVDPFLLAYVRTHSSDFLGFTEKDVEFLRRLESQFQITPLFYSVTFTGPVTLTNTDHEAFVLRSDTRGDFVKFSSKIIPRTHLLALKALSFAKSSKSPTLFS